MGIDPWDLMAVQPVLSRPPALVARHPLRCWQRRRLPDPLRQDALLQLASIATAKAALADDPGDFDRDFDQDILPGTGPASASARWRTLAACVAVGDAAALLALGRALLVDQGARHGPVPDPALSALRLAIHHGGRDVRIVAAAEMLLALPQLLGRPLLSPTRRGRAVVAEELAYRALRAASPQGGATPYVVAGLVTAWVRTTADALRRDFPVPVPDVGTAMKDHTALLAALEGGTRAMDKGEAAAAPRPVHRRGRGYGLVSEVFPGGEGAVPGPGVGDGPTLVPFPAYSPAWTGEGWKAQAARHAGLGKPMPLVAAPRRAEADAALAALAQEMPNFGSAVGRVADHLCLARRLSPSPVLHLPPLLLVGPPGIGKTRFARRLAELLGVPFAWKGLAGSSDNRDLAGTSRGWSSAQPSWPVTQLVQLGVANPLLLLDEVDKAGGSERNGRAHDTMLSLLEPGTARRHEDECLGGPIDLSAISWILTANTVSGLPGPLRSRLAVVECGPPLPHQVAALVAGMLRDIADGYGLPDPRLLPPVSGELLDELRADYARHADPRRLRRGLVRALALAARLEEEPGHAAAPALH